MNRLRLMVTACTFFLLLAYFGQPAFAQSSSNQTQSLTNDQTFNQAGGTQSNYFEGARSLRAFPFPGNNPLPPYLPVPPHFAPPVTDGNYGALETILPYKNEFTMSDAEAFLEQHKKFFQKIRIMTSCFKPGGSRSFLRILPVPKDTKEKAAFKQKYELIGIGNYKSMTTKTISEQILGVAIKEGLSIGADVMLFQEGAALIQTAKGWSIGFFNSLSTANVPDGTGYGNVVVGGLGFGRGESGYQSKPWLRVQFFRDLGVQPYVPMSQRQGAKQGKLDVNSYEESLKKPGKQVTPEGAFQLK